MPRTPGPREGSRSKHSPDWLIANLAIERKATLNRIIEMATNALEYQDDRMLRGALVDIVHQAKSTN